MADSNSLDSNITQNQPVQLGTINIDVSVTPGHDMVVNHVDGSQELAPGHVALAVMAAEAKQGNVVSLDAVDAQPSESPRSNDPEVNGPDNQGQPQGKTADEVVAASQADAPVPPVPASPTEAAAAPAADAGKAPAQPSLADVEGV